MEPSPQKLRVAPSLAPSPSTSETKTKPMGETKTPGGTAFDNAKKNGKTSKDLLLRLPDHVLTDKVFTYFGFKEYALTSCASTYLQVYWKEANQKTPLPLYIPEDCWTLREAVIRVDQDCRITTILLGEGEHVVDGRYLEIPSAMKIVGRPGVAKKDIEVVGGIKINAGTVGNVHLANMTICDSKSIGVNARSSFTMENVVVERCGFDGVVADGAAVVGKCTNVEVRQCENSGLIASMGASMTLVGAKTTVHHNCTSEGSGYRSYGLQVYGPSSTIQLVSPLTKETVSIDNGGGGNCGVNFEADIGQIKTVVVAMGCRHESKSNSGGLGRGSEK
jgi:hypothetical protein